VFQLKISAQQGGAGNTKDSVGRDEGACRYEIQPQQLEKYCNNQNREDFAGDEGQK